MAGLRIIFMGTPDFACPTLTRLIERGEDVIAVVTQPDRPKGRGQKLVPPPVKVIAEEHGIPVLQPQKVRAPEVITRIRELNPDLIVVVAFGQILPQSLLDIPRHGCINIHASLLPRYRGAAPINWCLINGETETGITTMQMDAGLDTGDMLVKRAIPIGPDEDAQSLHDRLSLLGAETIDETLDRLQAGTLTREKQDDTLTCYAPMLKKEDGLVDWKQEPQQIKNLVRGFTPWPGAYTTLDDKTLKLYKVSVANGCGRPGDIMAVGKDGIIVGCGSGSLCIEELQLEGRKRLSASDFLAGCRLEPGNRLGH
ncbi:methionyl-tRNA formyltransferase [Geobacter hydrogenophilus]|uniref:Methionyl-tRNA formyltransferase n=1 Tax=Geobacter hydrogenophilus TaxID=40983 RepID=A0A9W6FZA3_9BACT|nr:methionyl-tRNA formyltransferase [Geobacter hydrogenophilus]MBT0893471.1 methionyl-tRNA formyltransferase [Geobacter hydrogenophilus]GLI37835.1 methionyl-tRNA formyltransferase [Geobacter hydrogenophilus]